MSGYPSPTWENKDLDFNFIANYHSPQTQTNPLHIFSLVATETLKGHKKLESVGGFSYYGLNLLLHTHTLFLIHSCWWQGSSPISSCITTVCDSPHTTTSSCAALSEPTLEDHCLLWVHHIHIHILTYKLLVYQWMLIVIALSWFQAVRLLAMSWLWQLERHQQQKLLLLSCQRLSRQFKKP